MTLRALGYALATAAVALGCGGLPTRVAATAPEPVAEDYSDDVFRMDIHIPAERRVLPNGLEVVVAPDHRTHDVAVFVRYHVGGADDPPGMSGLAHLVEHLSFVAPRGIARDTFLAELGRIGARSANGSTTWDATDYYGTVDRGALARLLWMERQRMATAFDGLDDALFGREVRVVQDELRAREGLDVDRLVARTVMRLAFGEEHPYARSPGGDVGELARVGRADAEAFYRAAYGPNNATLVMVGDVTVERALALANEHFGDLPPVSPRSPARRPEPRLHKKRLAHVEAPVPRSSVIIAWPTPAAGTTELQELDVAVDAMPYFACAEILSLRTRLRAGALGGVTWVWAEARGGTSAVAAYDRLAGWIDEFEPSAGRVRDRRLSSVADLLYDVEALHSRAELLTTLTTQRGTPDAIRGELDRRATVRASDVVRAYRTRLRDRDGRVVVLVTPNPSAPPGGRVVEVR